MFAISPLLIRFLWKLAQFIIKVFLATSRKIIPLTYVVLKILYRRLKKSGFAHIMMYNFTKSKVLDMIADKINIRKDIRV